MVIIDALPSIANKRPQREIGFIIAERDNNDKSRRSSAQTPAKFQRDDVPVQASIIGIAAGCALLILDQRAILLQNFKPSPSCDIAQLTRYMKSHVPSVSITSP